LRHQQKRYREDGEAVQADRLVADPHDRADEAIHDVVRQQPGEPLVEYSPRTLMTLDARRKAQQAHVDEEVHGSGQKPDSGDNETAKVARALPDGEHRRRGERRQRHGPDVVNDRVQRVATRAPVDDGNRHSERQSCAVVEEGGAREGTDDADRQ